MGDKLKVFTDGVLTGADATGDLIPLVTTGATDQAVIKDIQFSEVTHVDSSIVLGAATLATSLTNMTGSEIVDNNETMHLKLPESVEGVNYLPYDILTCIQTTSSIRKKGPFFKVNAQDTDSLIYTASTSRTSPDIDELITVPSLSNSAIWFFKNTNYAYYFYYDGNSSTYLYRAPVTSGVVGTWGQMHTTGYNYACYNPLTQEIYVHEGSGLYKFDALTNAGKVLLAYSISPAPSSYAKTATLGDWVVSTPSGTNTRLIDTSTGTVPTGVSRTLTNNVQVFANSGLCLIKTATHYILATGNGTDIHLRHMTIADFEGSGTALTTGATLNNVRKNNHSPMIGDDQGNIYYTETSGKLAKASIEHDSSTLEPTIYDVVQLANSGFASPPAQIAGYPVPKADLNISIQCRVSGVEITE